MFVSVLAAGLFLMADVTPSAQPADAAATQASQTAAKPEMKRVCVKQRSTDSSMPRTTCRMVPVETAKAADEADKPQAQ